MQREIFDVWLLSMFWLTMSFNAELPKICFSNVWTRIRLESLWVRFMKAFVVLINHLLRWSGFLEEPVSIGLPWCLIASNIIKHVKSVSGLVICNWCPLRWCILLFNHGRSEVGGWISLDKLIFHLQRGIDTCWLLRIISLNGPKQFLWRIWHTRR